MIRSASNTLKTSQLLRYFQNIDFYLKEKLDWKPWPQLTLDWNSSSHLQPYIDMQMILTRFFQNTVTGTLSS